MIRAVSAVLILAFAAGSALASPPGAATNGKRARFTPRDLVAFRTPGELETSRDGRMAVFVVDHPDFEHARTNRELHAVTVDGRTPERQLTFSVDWDEWSPEFSPDGRWIAFLSDRPAPGVDAIEFEEMPDEERVQVWLLPTDGGEARALTEAERGVIGFDWLPSSKGIVFTATEALSEAELAVRARRAEALDDSVVVDRERFRREFWTATIDGKTTERVSRGDLGIESFRVSPDGARVVYETNLTGREDDEGLFDLYILDLATGASTRLTQRAGGDHQPRWSPDGKVIAFTGYSDPACECSRVDLFVVPVAGGEPKAVSSSRDRSVERIAWTPDGASVVATVIDGVYQPVSAFGVDGVAAPRAIADAVIALEVAPLPDGRIVAIVESAVAPPDLVVLGGASAVPLTTLNPEVASFEIAPQEVVRWTSPDGTPVEGILVRPLGVPAGTRAPLVVALHGGPFGRAEMSLRGYYYHPQLWAANGYAVLLPNFRGSDGYGNAFGMASRDDLGGGDYRDIMAGVDKVIALGVADPDRMGVMGLSYGGYMTNWIIGHTDRFKGAISESGVFSLITDYSNTVIPSWEVQYLKGYWWDRFDAYVRQSPAMRVANIRTPVLIMHGDDDTNTFVSNSKEMYQALRALGRTAEFVRYPREEHGVDEPAHRIDQANRWVAWFDRWVRGADSGAREKDRWVAVGDWELLVSDVEPDAEIAGFDAAKRPVRVSVLIRSTDTTKSACDVMPGEFRLELPGGPSVTASGVVLASDGAQALVQGIVRIRAKPSGTGDRVYVPMVLAFDAPAESVRAVLRFRDAAPIRIDLAGK